MTLALALLPALLYAVFCAGRIYGYRRATRHTLEAIARHRPRGGPSLPS